MSGIDRIRLDALNRVKRGELTVVGSAELMGVSLRQARRLWKRFKESGASGLLHKLRGRLSNRRLSQDVRERVVKRHQERYSDFGPTLACEKLEEEGLKLRNYLNCSDLADIRWLGFSHRSHGWPEANATLNRSTPFGTAPTICGTG